MELDVDYFVLLIFQTSLRRIIHVKCSIQVQLLITNKIFLKRQILLQITLVCWVRGFIGLAQRE